MLHSFFEGLTQGIFLLQETIAKKSLSATDFHVTVLTILIHIGLVFSIFFGVYFRGRKKAPGYVVGLLAGRLIFLFSFLIGNIYIFIGFVFLYYFSTSVISPGINSVFKNEFKITNRGKLFSMLRAAMSLSAMLSSYIAGKYLDLTQNYRIVLIAAGIFGVLSFLMLIAVDNTADYSKMRAAGPAKPMPLDRDFLRFEACFMTYGFAFMIMLPAAPIYLIDKMGFSFTQMGFVKGAMAQIFFIMFIPFAGAVFDRMSPWKVFRNSQILLSLFPLGFLLADTFFPHRTVIYAAFLFYGMGISSMTVLWTLASIYFAKGEDSSYYQSVHVAFTGVRGLLAPALSYFLFRTFSFRVCFIMAAVLFLAAFAMAQYRILAGKRTFIASQ